MATVTKKKRATRKRKPTIVGREGTIRFSPNTNKIRVVVLEDRGRIGLSGRQFLRVRFAEPDEDPPTSFEIPAEIFELSPLR